MHPKTFTERFLLCYLHLNRREQEQHNRSLSYDELTRRIGARLGEPISGTTVTRWRDGSEPSRVLCEAAAYVLGVDPGWLMFGDASRAPAPEWLTASDAADAAAARAR